MPYYNNNFNSQTMPNASYNQPQYYTPGYPNACYQNTNYQYPTSAYPGQTYSGQAYQNQLNAPTGYTQQMTPAINGRSINDVNEIRVQDIPTDGTAAIFPMMDQSCIYIKSWQADGTISTIRFVPEVTDTGNESLSSSNNELAGIKEQLNRIEEAMSRRNQYRGKKEVNNESNQ